MKKEKIPVTAIDLNLSVKDINIKEIIPNCIENVILSVEENKCMMDLPNNMSGNEFKRWKTGKGGIFATDVLNHANNKPTGKYLILEENNQKKIVRLIEDEELDKFDNLKLISGKIKDKSYMFLKQVNDGESIIKTNRYIEQSTEESDVPKIIIPDISSVPEDSDSHSSRESISLFD